MMLYLLCYPSLFFLSTFYANTRRPRKVVQEAPAEVKEESVTETTTTPAADKELLLKLLEKPEMAQLLKALAQTL